MIPDYQTFILPLLNLLPKFLNSLFGKNYLILKIG